MCALAENISRGYYIITARISSIMKKKKEKQKFRCFFDSHTRVTIIYFCFARVLPSFRLRFGCYVRERDSRSLSYIYCVLAILCMSVLWSTVTECMACPCVCMNKIVCYKNKWTHLDLANKNRSAMEGARVFTFFSHRNFLFELNKQNAKIWHFKLENVFEIPKLCGTSDQNSQIDF